ncbi:MAG: endonuclease IV [Ruminococcaceae bacterium]|nr:endonuclease IV [Oscillospiraceae bacterium]
MSTLFGVAGNSDSFHAAGHKSSVEAPKWLHDFGLDAYEYQCGKGVLIGVDTAREIGAKAKEYQICMSVHAPYFMNLANPDPERREKTAGYALKSCEAAQALGATRVVIHSGSLMKRTRSEALEIACETMKLVVDACDAAGYGEITLCPELMGGVNQLGSLEEVMELCKVDRRLVPCIDFGHYNARNNGILRVEEDFEAIFDVMEAHLGFDRVKRFHSHFSKIEFTEKSGEVRHLTFEDQMYGPDFVPLARVLVKRGYEPTIICESAGTQAEDALAMKQMYQKEV